MFQPFTCECSYFVQGETFALIQIKFISGNKEKVSLSLFLEEKEEKYRKVKEEQKKA